MASPATRWKVLAALGLVVFLGGLAAFVLQHRVPAEKAIEAGARAEFNLKTGEVKQAKKKEAPKEEVAKDESKPVEEAIPPALKEVAEKEATAEATPAAAKEEKVAEAPKEAEKPAEGTAGAAPAEVGKKPEAAEAKGGPVDIKAPAEQGPVIAIVIAGAGLSRSTTEPLYELPPEVTLSFSPYASELKAAIKKATADGHEVYLDLPLEPKDYPYTDPGPYALMTGLDEAVNRARLKQVLSRADGVAGVLAGTEEKFTANSKAMQWLVAELKNQQHPLAYLAQPVNAHLQQGKAGSLLVIDRLLDAKLEAEEIDAQLKELEELARRTGKASALARPYPLTIERLKKWSAEAKNKGLRLVPLSALRPEAAHDGH